MTTAQSIRGETSAGIVFERRGAGRPVVLVHGWSLSGRLWRHEEELLAEDYDVVVPDLAGFGRSAGLAAPYNVARHATDLRALLDEEGLDEAVLVGFAFGGAVAMHAAAADRRRVHGVVAVGTPQPGELPVERMVASMRRDWPAFCHRSAAVICREPQSEATMAWLEGIFSATRLPVAIEAWRDIATFDPLPVAAQLPMPTLFVHGANDDFSAADVANRCAAAAPAGRAAITEPSGHLVLLDQPAWFHQTLLSFLQEIG